MKRHLKTPAIILAGRDLGESDRLLTLFTRDLGRLSAVARAARRSKRLIDQGRDLLHLDSCDLVEPFEAIRADVRRYAGACYLCELARELFPEREPAQAAFGLLSHALGRLAGGQDAPAWERLAALRLLALAGFAPRLEGCLRCGAPPEPPLRFLPAVGGLLCPACAATDQAAQAQGPVEVSAGTLRLLSEALRLEPGRLSRLRFSRLALQESERLLTALVRQVLGKDLKSRRFRESVGPLA